MTKAVLTTSEEQPQAEVPRAEHDSRVARLDRSGSAVGKADTRHVSPERQEPSSNPKSAVGNVMLGLFKLALPLAVIASAVYGAGYLRDARPPPPPRQAAEIRVPVQTVLAEPRTVQPELRIFGETVAGRQVEMRSLVGGRVIETGDALREGAVANKGDTLLVIDPFDYRSQIRETEAQLDEARARLDEYEAALAVEQSDLEFAREQLKLATDDLARAEELARRGNLAQRSVDERRLVVSQRQQAVRQDENSVKLQAARVAQQKAAIARLENTLERNEKRLAETQLVAPFEAYVTDVGAQVGRMLNENDRVATLIDRNWIDVSFTLTDRQYGRLRDETGSLIGRDVEVLWDIGTSPRRYTATIERVAARVTSDTGGVDVFARVENPLAGVPLRPGAFVRVILKDAEYADVLKLPAASVYDGRTIYVVVDNRLQERTVEVVGVDGADLLVRGDVERGARILATRMAAPGPGVAVEDL